MDAMDSQDSLAALPGMVRASIAVLKGLTNPLIVDDVVPRAALKLVLLLAGRACRLSRLISDSYRSFGTKMS